MRGTRWGQRRLTWSLQSTTSTQMRPSFRMNFPSARSPAATIVCASVTLLVPSLFALLAPPARDVHVDPNSVKITPQLIPILSQSVRVGLLSTTFIQDRRDDPTDSHKGVYNTIDIGVATRAFGSEASFARLVMRNSTYHRLSRDLVFARSTNFGVIERFAGAGVPEAKISFQRDTYTFNFPGKPSELVGLFRAYYGPTMNAFEAAAANGREAVLQAELDALFNSQNTSPSEDAISIPATFLGVTVAV